MLHPESSKIPSLFLDRSFFGGGREWSFRIICRGQMIGILSCGVSYCADPRTSLPIQNA